MGTSAPEATPPEFLSRAEAARRLGLSVQSVRRRVNDGSLPSVKVGGRRLIPRAAIDALVAQAMRAAR
jgi:excisionase family DNA binding protein